MVGPSVLCQRFAPAAFVPAWLPRIGAVARKLCACSTDDKNIASSICHSSLDGTVAYTRRSRCFLGLYIGPGGFTPVLVDPIRAHRTDSIAWGKSAAKYLLRIYYIEDLPPSMIDPVTVRNHNGTFNITVGGYVHKRTSGVSSDSLQFLGAGPQAPKLITRYSSRNAVIPVARALLKAGSSNALVQFLEWARSRVGAEG